jgi:hypothetical protein
MRIRSVFAILVLALQFSVPTAANAASLTPDEQLSIARSFAPMLVFHPDEEYFPVSSMYELDSPVGDRVASYRDLTHDAKLSLAAVGYRVFPRVDHGESEIVVEYWCHYVYNEYSVRLAFLPLRVSDNHPEDLERLYVVLATDPVTGIYHIRRVVANAHDGSVPPNEYDTQIGGPITAPLTMLVERGSHAMAPDINHDGSFTPRIDSTTTGKMLWGIRDEGKAWSWYRRSFMDMRDATAVHLCVAAGDAQAPQCRPYALYAVSDEQRWFDGLQLTKGDRTEIVGRTSWVDRAFGDVRVENLMVPKDPANDSMLNRMLNRRTRAEGGMEVGFSTTRKAPTAVVGRQFFWDLPSRGVPDITADVTVALPHEGHTSMQGLIAGTYAIDATTNVLFGEGISSRARRTTDPIVGFDIRVGRFHLEPIHRLHGRGFHTTLALQF